MNKTLSQKLEECISCFETQSKEQFLANLKELNAKKSIGGYLNNDEYFNLMQYVISSFGRFGMYSEAIDFFNQEFEAYCECCRFDYPQKSALFELMARTYLMNGDADKAEDAMKTSVYYCFIPNISYDRFEYFSFRSVNDHSLDDIKNNTLTVSNPTQFNDPLDTLLLTWNAKLIEDTEDPLEKELLEMRQKTYGFIKARCFARKDKLPEREEFFSEPPIIKGQNVEDLSPLMWAHYADSHKGICIRYILPANFVSNKDHNSRTWSMMANMRYVSQFTFDSKAPFTVNDAFLKKYNIWEYENEVRLIHYDPEHTEDFKELPLPEHSIKAIYFGINCSDEDKNQIKDIVGDDVELYQMEFDTHNAYKMRARKL